MDHSNKIRNIFIFITTLFLLIILSYFTLFKRRNDYYVIKDVKISFVEKSFDSINDFSLIKQKNGNTKNSLGLCVIFSKKYISDKKEKRFLRFSKTEPGVLGIKSKIQLFDVYLKINNDSTLLNKYLKTSKIYFIDKKQGSAITNLNNNEVTLTKFINDLKSNEKYTRGLSFDNTKIYFWFSDEIDLAVLKQNQIIVEYEIDNKKTYKQIK